MKTILLAIVIIFLCWFCYELGCIAGMEKGYKDASKSVFVVK